ncbi:hypothetical protein JYU34_002330 [Plutella xylostella]|uniref:Regulatory protein zeste n=2 Tax=Plutella xylostella TaxID=51655 RepID=A0A8S4DJ04_PLUXY|nr:uncharacterized protein LOC105383727 [Plutella xylostella]KAG7311298.1 hypothetical protein JYU34_002330 [Plutella xylostella]CAG9098215.1 unnamed protein product [Plutella xylostella]
MEAKKQATGAQITALLDYMQENPELSKGLVNSGLEREEVEAQWRELAQTLNNMGGSVKSVDKWKQTWRDLKSNSKKRALRAQQYEPGGSTSAENSQSADPNDNDNGMYSTPKKRYVSFDEELLRIEREKLEVDREYKVQKIEVLSRIAAALEELGRKKEIIK